MAIDTRAKRQSAANCGCPLPTSYLPTGTIDAPGRETVSWTYAGIAADAPAAGGVSRLLTLVGVGQ